MRQTLSSDYGGSEASPAAVTQTYSRAMRLFPEFQMSQTDPLDRTDQVVPPKAAMAHKHVEDIDATLVVDDSCATLIEKVIGDMYDEMAEAHESYTCRLLKDAREGLVRARIQRPAFIDAVDPFAVMRDIRFRGPKDGKALRVDQKLSRINLPIISIKSDKMRVPSYTQWSMIPRSILVPESTHLEYTPYLGDYDAASEKSKQAWLSELKEMHEQSKDLLASRRNELAVQVMPHLQDMMKEAGTTKQRILDCLPKAKSVSEPDSVTNLVLTQFKNRFRIPLDTLIPYLHWETTISHVTPIAVDPMQKNDSSYLLGCLVCGVHECGRHGDEEIHIDDTETLSTRYAGLTMSYQTVKSRQEELANDHRTSIHPSRADIPSLQPGGTTAHPEHRKLPKSWYDNRTKKMRYDIDFGDFTLTHKHDEGPQRRGCVHPGVACPDAVDCICILGNILCEPKLCSCPEDCEFRFKGCACESVCTDQFKCPCRSLNRECDPDLCTSCGAAESAEHDHNHPRPARLCRNVEIQRGVSKLLGQGQSTITEIGYGGYILEPAAKHDFVAEYVGEMIRTAEAERRGRIYNEKKSSYIFSLNSEYEIDAARYGNLTRFFNHSQSGANIVPKVLLVNGEHRIGFFATKPLHAGEELWFNYGSRFQNEINLVEPEINNSGTAHGKRKRKTSKQSAVLMAMDDDEGSENESDEIVDRRPKRSLRRSLRLSIR